MLDSRFRLLRAAVGFVLVPPTEPELRLLHRWLDSWRGVGDVVTGMNRQGYWLHLSNIDVGTWRATFSRSRWFQRTASGQATRRGAQWQDGKQVVLWPDDGAAGKSRLPTPPWCGR